MFEYLQSRINAYEQERLEQMLARRRFIAEHPEQVVRRPESGWRRMLRQLLRRGAGDSAARSASRSASAPCETATAG